jgi:excisionase family DNA binding protein
MADPEILTVDEAAALLRMDRKTVYALVEKRQLPGARRLGKCIRIHRPTLLKWMETGNAGKGAA